MRKCFVPFVTINLVLSFVLFSFFFSSCTWISKGTQIREIPMDLIIGDYTGLTLDADAIHFGTVEKGKNDQRTRLIQISNDDNKTREVQLTARGQLSSFVQFSENYFILGPYENKTIEITVSPSSDMDYGNYTGAVRAVILEKEV